MFVGQTDVAAELRERIQADLRHFGGSMPQKTAIAWSGYLAGLMEWGVLDRRAYYELDRLLPRVPDDPVTAILEGRDDPDTAT